MQVSERRKKNGGSIKHVEEEWQKGTGMEGLEGVLHKVRKVVCRKRQILLWDQMIQLGKKSVGFLAQQPKTLMWSLLETTGEGGYHSILTFQTLGSFQTSLQVSLMSIPSGDCLGLRTEHIPVCHITHGETSLWCCGESLAARNCSVPIHNGGMPGMYQP